MHPERQSLETMARFLPAGAHVLNVGFAPDLFDECVPDECRRPGTDADPIDDDAVRNGIVELPRGGYVVLHQAVTASREAARLLRSVAAAGAHLVCTCRHAEGHGVIPDAIADTITESGCMVRAQMTVSRDLIAMCVSERPPATPQEFQVVTLSWASMPNFGDRLGMHLINQLLPAHATVRHEFRIGPQLLERPIEVLVLGLGFSIFQPMLTENLLRLVDNSERVIGIFGTQYRKSIDRSVMKRLLQRLDVWYARYREDLLLFGGECRSEHLGDWMINAFPLTRPVRRPALAETLVIGPEIISEEVSLDRLIHKIQLYRRVVAARLHPLLCALTSAEEVAYCEQREDGSKEVSGKFRSMLLDVFGVHYPPEEFFPVDRAAVRRYRAHVESGIRALGVDLRRAGAKEEIGRPARASGDAADTRLAAALPA